MYIAPRDRGEDEVLEDLMDEIDPDLEYSVEVLNLAGRILLAGVRSGAVQTEAEYERALVRSAELAYGEWIV